MPSFTGTQVADQARILLNNTAATVYSNTRLLPIINMVLDELLLDLLELDLPVTMEVKTAHTLAANTTSLTPSAVHARFVQPIYIYERPNGSTVQYNPMKEWHGFLPDRVAIDRLIDWTWRNETMYFVGATSIVQLLIKHTVLLPNLAAIGDSINLTGALPYMSAKTAAYAAFSIGKSPSEAAILDDLAGKQKQKYLNNNVKKDQFQPLRRPGFRRPRRQIP